MSEKKHAFCKVSIAPIRKENSDASEMVSQLLFGEIIEIEEIQNNWTRIRTYFDNYEGWIDTKHFMLLSEKEMKRYLDGIGILSDFITEIKTPWGKQYITRGAFVPEVFETDFKIGNSEFSFLNKANAPFSQSLAEFALAYLNAPYLWGGKSPFGIDCSGLTQQVFRYFDKNLPRDAYQQAEIGIEIPFEEQEEGDLAFFTNEKGKIIHVGIILENRQIIHASGFVRIDTLKPDGIYKTDSDEKTHSLFVIKRI